MYFARSFFLALASTPFMALAQSGANPFNVPTSGLSTSAGQSLALSWNPTTQGTVSLVLRSGNSGDLSSGTTIASSIPNSGSYTWSVPSNVVRGSSYTVEIVDDSNTSETNYTPPFVIDSSVLVSSSATGSASMSTVTSGAPSSSLSLSSASASGSQSTGTATRSSSAGSASTTASTSGSASSTSGATSSASHSGSSASGSSSSGSSTSGASFQSSATAAASQTSKAVAPRATMMAGMMGAVALGALAL